MTQIVWDGRFLVADRKCFRKTTPFSAQKIRIQYNTNYTQAFAFAGTYEECHIAEKIMLMEDNAELVEQAKSILVEPATNWQGLCIEKDHHNPVRLFLCNYLGMREELPLLTPFAVGALADEIIASYRTWEACAKNIGVPAYHLFVPAEERTLDEFRITQRRAQALVNFLRSVLKGTYFDQEGYLFDVYDSITGEVLCL